ncbi:DUF533 domain-containing protein [Ahniella affigens]|uniref:DUF533 domain-containing protein n=1 Tax=Ahniella affigens TaxID=2021234 RepID=A0A2P1PR77_9GAMM|nr:DUF533 domain-containing protein [Ahniella affigens]AVP97335.1 DUF533 domain-containing protein [Ahniella affigens]
MFDPEKLLAGMVGDALGGMFGGRSRKKKSVFRTGNLGGKAALGLGALGVAMAAYEHFQQRSRQPTGSAPMPIQPGPRALPPAPASLIPSSPAAMPPPPPAAVDLTRLNDAEQEAVLLVQTMIAAAHADGRVDASEQQRILARAESSGLDTATCFFLKGALNQPISLDQIAAQTRPDQVDEVYAAALLAMDADTEAERAFLRQLGQKLGMDDARRLAIHEALQPV